MITVSLKDAQTQLPELITRLRENEYAVITQNGEPVAYLSPVPTPRNVPKFGSCRGMLTANENDEKYLADFADYTH